MDVEPLLRRERLILLAALLALTAIAAVYTIAGVGMEMSAIEMTRMAGMPGADAPPMPMDTMPMDTAPMDTAPLDMGAMGSMPMGSMAMAPAAWGMGYALLVFLMWWVMMVAMMTPSAAPTVLLYAAVRRQRHPQAEVLAESGRFVAGYLVVWGLFSLAATGLQWGLERDGLVSPMMMTVQDRLLGVAILLAAGIYQLTPLKRVCLEHCRSPAEWLARHHRLSPFRKGVAHGAFCLGCCWALMLLLFFGGIMNLYWIVGLAVLVIAEKLLPRGDLVAMAAGVVLIVAAGWMALSLLG